MTQNANFYQSIQWMLSIFDSKAQPTQSVVADIRYYFTACQVYDNKSHILKQKLAGIHKDMIAVSNPERTHLLSEDADKLKLQKQKLTQEFEAQRVDREKRFLHLCEQVIDCLVGVDDDDTDKRLKATFGALLMMTPNSQLNIAADNMKRKPLFRCVVSLLLLKEIWQQNHPLLEHFKPFMATQADFFSEECKQQVLIPTVLACFCMDAGLWHRDARKLLADDNNVVNEFKNLSTCDRKQLLKISYKQTYIFAEKGLFGKSNNSQTVGADLVKGYLSGMIDVRSPIGSLLKVVQSYTGLLLPTKEYYNYNSLPMTLFILKKRVDESSFVNQYLDIILNKVGMYPPGFGVCFVSRQALTEKQPQTELESVVDNVDSVAATNETKPSSVNTAAVAYGVVCEFANTNSTATTALVYQTENLTDHSQLVTSDKNLFLPSVREKYFPKVPPSDIQSFRFTHDDFQGNNRKQWFKYCGLLNS